MHTLDLPTLTHPLASGSLNCAPDRGHERNRGPCPWQVRLAQLHLGQPLPYYFLLHQHSPLTDASSAWRELA